MGIAQNLSARLLTPVFSMVALVWSPTMTYGHVTTVILVSQDKVRRLLPVCGSDISYTSW